MVRHPQKPPESFGLKAQIRTSDIAYHLAASPDHEFSEVLSLEIAATIESIHPKFERHLGKDLCVSFTASGRFSREEFTYRDANAIYLIDLRADSRYLSGVIPSDAIWTLPGLIDGGQISYLVVSFEPPQHGKAKVTSVDFLSEAAFADH